MAVFTMPADEAEKKEGDLETCLAGIAAGEKAALARFYEQTYAAAYGLAVSILQNRQDAEDVVQDTYLKIWQAADCYQAQGRPRAWMLAIVRNTALMRLRQARRTVSLDGEDWNLWADEPAVSPEDRLLLSALLGQLGEEDRQIVVMHALAGLKHREIAAMLGMGLPAVMSRYSRGMKKLRRALKEADGHDKS